MSWHHNKPDKKIASGVKHCSTSFNNFRHQTNQLFHNYQDSLVSIIVVQIWKIYYPCSTTNMSHCQKISRYNCLELWFTLLWSINVRRPCVRPSVCLSIRKQLLKKSSPLKPVDRFQWNFTEMILEWCTFRKLQRFKFREELWLPWQPKEKTLKIFLSQTVRARALIFGM